MAPPDAPDHGDPGYDGPDHAHAGHDHGPEGAAGEAGDCGDAIAELYTFLDGELTDERRTLIRAHLDGCSPCFEAFDFEAELRIVIAHRCKDSVPDQLRHRIAALLDPSADAGDAPS